MVLPIREGRVGRIGRYLAWPVRELVLAWRDRRSPEMREIRERAKIAEIKQSGETIYIIRETLKLVGFFAGFSIIWTASEAIGGKGTFDVFGSNPTIRTFIYLGMIGVVVGAFGAYREIERLRSKYPEEFSDEEV